MIQQFETVPSCFLPILLDVPQVHFFLVTFVPSFLTPLCPSTVPLPVPIGPLLTRSPFIHCVCVCMCVLNVLYYVYSAMVYYNIIMCMCTYMCACVYMYIYLLTCMCVCVSMCLCVISQSQSQENEFAALDGGVMKKLASRGGQKQCTVLLNLKVLTGDLNTLKRDLPNLKDAKMTTVAHKLGFPDIILPGYVRNDIYVTLSQSQFDKGEKRAERNVEVSIVVRDNDGKLIPVRVLVWGHMYAQHMHTRSCTTCRYTICADMHLGSVHMNTHTHTRIHIPHAHHTHTYTHNIHTHTHTTYTHTFAHKSHTHTPHVHGHTFELL